MVVEFNESVKVAEEAKYISEHSEYSMEEAHKSILRGISYFSDCGDEGEDAFDKAVELVSMAVVTARNEGFDLMGAVDYMLFSVQHRVPGTCSF